MPDDIIPTSTTAKSSQESNAPITVMPDFDERDCSCRRELDNCPVQIPNYVPPSTNLHGRVGHNT